MRYISTIVLLLLITACQKENNTNLSTYFTYEQNKIESAGVKMIPVITPVGEFKVWTKRFGNNPKIKILLLYGGPAMTHEYMECFETFFQREGFELYEYDQLGSYYSDQPTDSSLWTIDRLLMKWNKYVKQLMQIKIIFRFSVIPGEESLRWNTL